LYTTDNGCTLRRAGPQAAGSSLVIGDLALDASRHEVRRGDQVIDLTPLEFQILEMLMQAAGKVIKRADLAIRLMETGYSGSEATLKIHIRNLRLKLEDNMNQPRYIETVFGVGYRFLEVA
jgi:DNA-binding response OmpR family regulator